MVQEPSPGMGEGKALYVECPGGEVGLRMGGRQPRRSRKKAADSGHLPSLGCVLLCVWGAGELGPCGLEPAQNTLAPRWPWLPGPRV